MCLQLLWTLNLNVLILMQFSISVRLKVKSCSVSICIHFLSGWSYPHYLLIFSQSSTTNRFPGADTDRRIISALWLCASPEARLNILRSGGEAAWWLPHGAKLSQMDHMKPSKKIKDRERSCWNQICEPSKKPHTLKHGFSSCDFCFHSSNVWVFCIQLFNSIWSFYCHCRQEQRNYI